jgi:hypothetical protein
MADNDAASVKKKMQKKDTTFTDSVDGLPAADLKANILIYSKHLHDTEMALKNDEDIQRTSEELKELKAPYSETSKMLKEKINYLHIILKDKEIEKES